MYDVSKSDGKEEETMFVFGSIFGRNRSGKGSPRFMNCLLVRFSVGRGQDGKTRLFSRLNGMFSTVGARARGMRPGRSGAFFFSSAAPKKFGRAVPLQIGGAHPRTPSPRRWGKQKGRTLLEMLGVLAIVGILSIAALVGFTYAMNKHRANETVYDVMLRGTNVPMVDENYASKPSGHEFTFPDLPAGTYYPMTTKKDAGSSYYVEATGVTYRVCEMILKMNPIDIAACEGGTEVEGFCMSGIDLNWWSAANWCKANGMHLATVYEVCPDWDGNTGRGKCGRTFSLKGNGRVATTLNGRVATTLDSIYALYVDPSDGEVGFSVKNGSNPALCTN